jgi:hypothetical protein
MANSIKINPSLFLNKIPVSSDQPQKIQEPLPTNHVVVIDCSGSMSGELPQIRAQLKKKLPKLLAEWDTLSIIWFSGKNQCGVLLENEPVRHLADLSNVEKAIDRWLKPVGLTGFKEPLVLASELMTTLTKAKPKSVNSLFFMSDGCDNQWSKNDILKAVDKIASVCVSATFVEYGYYADRPTLTAMSEKAGGSLIFAEDFDRYEPVFEAAMAKKILGGKKIEVDLKNDAIGGFAFAMQDNDLLAFSVEGSTVKVPETVSSVYFLSSTGLATESLSELAESSSRGSVSNDFLDAAYGAISLYSMRMKTNVVLELLKSVGDASLIDQFGSCFGKQKYSEFMETTKKAAFGEKRYASGYDPKRVPREDAFTVLQFLDLLSRDPQNRILLDHPSFQYNRISRARVDSSTVLTEEEQQQVKTLTEEMNNTRDAKKIAEITAQISALTNKPSPLQFETNPSGDGYSVENLTYNEDRPNISVLVKKTGTVDLSSRLTDQKIPPKFGTFIYRNYAIVKDGLVNVKTLPCKLTPNTIIRLMEAHSQGILPEGVVMAEGDAHLVHLDKLPVINRQMVKEVSANDLFTQCYNLTKLQAEAKVYNTIKKERYPKKSASFSDLYGEDGAVWLKEQGITDYSGFSPKMVQAESTDFYMGKLLKVSLKGLSTIPTLKAARENIAKKKINAPTAMMVPVIQEVDKLLNANGFDDNMFESWLDGRSEEVNRQVKSLIRQIAQTTFTTVVGQVWFKEFSSIDENTMTITVDGNQVACTVEMQDIEVKI